MRRAGRLPNDQAEIVFSDVFAEALAVLPAPQREEVLTETAMLCAAPGGKHPLKDALGGWNTLDVLGGGKRVVFKASSVDGVGLIEVLCLGPRTDSEVYDMAEALIRAGLLDAHEATQIWEALGILEIVAETVGLDGWDYAPAPANEGHVKAAVAAGLLSAATARLLSRDELAAAMEGGWGPTGPNPDQALRVALERARNRVGFPGLSVLLARAEAPCDAVMPRAGTRCIRRSGHPGPHRAR